MPVELGLELMTIVCAYLLDTEGELFDDVVNEVDGAGLRVALVNFQGAHPRGVVNRCILVALDLLTLFPFEDQELDVHLDVMTRHLLIVALGVHFPQSGPPRQTIHAMSLERSIDTRIGHFDAVIALQIPDDPDRAEVILAPEMEDLLFDLRRHLVRMIMWHGPFCRQVSFATFRVSFAPSIKTGAANPEIPTRLADITDPVGMFQNPKFTLYLALIAVH